nr:hypothetical protein [Tanacetum cinerariifolium]
MNQNFYNSNSSGFDQTQPPQFPVVHPPPQETSIEISHDQENDRVFEIKDAFENKQYKPEDIQDLFCKLFDDLQNIYEELAEFINSPGWNRPTVYNDDDDDVDYTNAITPVLSTEEPDNSLSMGDKHLNTIPATESNEVIKSSVKDLVPIPSEFKGIPNTMCDVNIVNNPTPLEAKDHFEIVINSNNDYSSSDDDYLYYENIEYVEASPHDSELVSLEVEKIVILEDEEIEDDNLRENLLKVNLLIAEIEALKDNPTPPSKFLIKSSSTSPKSVLGETNTFDNSLPEFENFCFDLEEISSGSTTTHSDISLSEYEVFSFHDDHIEKISSGSTTTQSDISLLEYDSFIFDLSNDQFPPTDRSDFTHEEFGDKPAHIISSPKYECFYFRNLPNLGELISIFNSRIRENLSSITCVNLPVKDDHSPLLAYVVWIFLAYLTYRGIPPHLYSFGNEDTIFDPGITINRFYSFKPGSVEDKILVPKPSKIVQGVDTRTNVVNAPREPFVVKQDHGVNPPHIDECCCECGKALDGIICQQYACKSCGKGFDQTQPPQFPVVHPPPQETSIEISHYQENVINSVQTFLRKFNRYSFFKTPKVLLLAWDRVSEIKDAFENKQYKPEDIQDLFRKLLDDLHNIHEELAEFINGPGWNHPFVYDDDDDDVDYIIAITPILSIEEPNNSLSMRDEHLDTISVTESDEVIKSSVKDLVLILSEFKGIPDTMCDVRLVNNPTPLEAKDHFKIVINSNDDYSPSDHDYLYYENIEYVEASPHDSKLVSLEVNLLIAKIEALKDNPTPSSEFLTKSSSTSHKSVLEETNTFDNSLPEFENFCFDLEEISSGSTTTHSNISLLEYEAFSFYDDHIEEISSGSTTTQSYISLPEYDLFIFNLSNDQFPPTNRSDFTHEEFDDEPAHIISPPEYECFYFGNLPDPGELISIFNFGIRENLSSTTCVNLPVEDDHSPLLAYVVWIFLAYLTYPVIPPHLHSFGNEDTIFDPGITINRFYSFKPGLSHRCGTFKKFNTHRSHLNESPMEMLFSTLFPMDQ